MSRRNRPEPSQFACAKHVWSALELCLRMSPPCLRRPVNHHRRVRHRLALQVEHASADCHAARGGVRRRDAWPLPWLVAGLSPAFERARRLPRRRSGKPSQAGGGRAQKQKCERSDL